MAGIDIEEFDEDTQRIIEALANGPDDKLVSLRSILGVNDDDGEDKGDDGKDVDPNDPDHIDADPDEEDVQDEDDRSSTSEPWSPVSLKQARQFIVDHPEASIDVIFPTVYEEDRSAKLKDIGTAQALGYISHQRSAEMVAKELGVDPYNYKEEMDQIEDETPPIDPAKDLASGDKVMQGMVGPLGGTPQKPGQQGPADFGGGMPGGDTGAPKIGDSGGGGMASESPTQARIVTPTGDPRIRRGPNDVRGEIRDDERAQGRAEMNATRIAPRRTADAPGGSPSATAPSAGASAPPTDVVGQAGTPEEKEGGPAGDQDKGVQQSRIIVPSQLVETLDGLKKQFEAFTSNLQKQIETLAAAVQTHVAEAARQPQPTNLNISVTPPDMSVNVQPAEVTVNVPKQDPPTVAVTVEAQKPMKKIITRDASGEIAEIRDVPEEPAKGESNGS